MASGNCDSLGWCRATYEICATHRECCGYRCIRDPFGFKRCVPIGGCRTSGEPLNPTGLVNRYGEVCTVDWECCSGLCRPDEDGIWRCRKEGMPVCGDPAFICLAHGEICETDCQCCAGAACRVPRPPDASGEPFPKRCVDAGFPVCLDCGQRCGDPGECCSGRCTLWEDRAFRCCLETVVACTPLGGTCTTDADCCAPLFCVPSGADRVCEYLGAA